MSRGMRQGGPLLPILFVVVGEVIANYLRNSPTIHSLKDGNIDYFLTQFADDTTLALEYSETNIRNVFKELEFISTLS